MVAISVENLKRSLPMGDQTIHILKGISFEVAQGEWVALTGPSGSGKSTLLGLLAGIDNPSSGRLIIGGTDITNMPEAKLARVRNEQIGIVFQTFNLIPTLTAQENVEMPLYISPHADEAADRARQMLERVGLGDRLDHRPHQLSGGQQQRVAIARALVTRPDIILADEPTGNLDTGTGAQIMDLFADLREQFGLTMVVVTHDPRIARHADRALHLVDGELVPSPITQEEVTYA